MPTSQHIRATLVVAWCSHMARVIRHQTWLTCGGDTGKYAADLWPRIMVGGGRGRARVSGILSGSRRSERKGSPSRVFFVLVSGAIPLYSVHLDTCLDRKSDVLKAHNTPDCAGKPIFGAAQKMCLSCSEFGEKMAAASSVH